jgi:predicted ATPase
MILLARPSGLWHATKMTTDRTRPMLVQRLILKNWRNFRNVDTRLRDVTYIVGANATGKSNLLDVFRFLRDICKSKGGGLQSAVADRGGISKLRCLHARNDPEVLVEVHLAEAADDPTPLWTYALAFKSETRGERRILITREVVTQRGESIALLSRPTVEDNQDKARLTQTNLEQIQTNERFRDIAAFFSSSLYLHVVPQMLKYADQLRGQPLENDPFGQGLLEHVARTPEKTRITRLKRIEEALQLAIPQFSELKFMRDAVTGQPHLEVRYKHYRPNAGWQQEDQWSDGTLRLFGLFWSLLETNTLLLLEEPELSLNAAIVEQIPQMLNRVQRDKSRRRQLILSTHSDALLRNPAIDPRSILRLEPGEEGSKVMPASPDEVALMKAGLSPAEVILPQARPDHIDQLRLF